jgi:hypothetical protein
MYLLSLFIFRGLPKSSYGLNRSVSHPNYIEIECDDQNSRPSVKINDNFTMFYANIQSIRNKILDLDVLLSELDPGIICLCEHWLKSDEVPACGITGYVAADVYCRSTLKNGGTMIYVKDCLQFMPSNINIEHLLTEKLFECPLARND